MTASEHRAGQLAALAQLEQLALPAPARTAIRQFEALLALPVPPPPHPGADRQAITALAADLARAALTGKRPAVPPVPLDVTPVAAARQAEQDGLDRAALARELRAAAAATLCAVFTGTTGQQAISAVQARHGQVMAELCGHTRQLPEGTDDQAALEHGGQIRVSYLAARDLTATVSQLREAVQLVEDRAPVAALDGLDLCLAFEQTGRLYQTWLAPAGVTTHGPLGTFEFYLSACKVAEYEWWAPTAAELEARAEQLRAKMHADRVAGLPPMPPRLPASSVF